MATYESLAQQALNQLLQRQYQEQAMQKNITGASSVPFLDAFSAGFNAGNGIVNAWRTREDNKRLRDFQKKQDDFNPENGNGNVTQQQQQLAQAQQIAYNNPEKLSFSNVFSVGQNPYNTSGGDIVNYNGRYFNSLQDNNPFGVSANDEGQRIAEQGSISPDLSNYNTSLQQVWGAGQTEPQQVQTQVQPQTQQQLSDYEARMNALPTAQNLDGRYSLSNYLNYARQNGMGNTQAMLNYYAFAMPFEQEARRARLEENFKIYNDPNATDEMKSRALAGMSYDLQNPDLVYDATQKRLKDKMLLEDRDYNKQMAMNKIIADMGYIPPGFEQYINGEMLGEDDEQPSANYSGVNLEGKSWIRNNNNVDLSNAKQNTITGLNHISDIFQKMTGKPLIVTSGNDGKMHASGEFSHGNGWKVDVSGNGLDDPKTRHAFIKQCENLGIKVLDEYENPSPNSTGGHLDLQFSGYTGSKPKKVSGFGMLRKTPKALREEARERRAEARELRAEEREARKAALDEANFKLKLARFYGNGSTGNGKTKGGAVIEKEDGTQFVLPKLKNQTNEEILKKINTYSEKSLDDILEEDNKESVYKVGEALAPQFQSYLVKFNGNEGQAIRQMAYDLQGNKEKGYSMNLDKLGFAIGSAYVSALGLKDDPANGINVNKQILNIKEYVKNFIEEEGWKTKEKPNQQQSNNSQSTQVSNKRITPNKPDFNKAQQNTTKYNTNRYNDVLRQAGLLYDEDDLEEE